MYPSICTTDAISHKTKQKSLQIGNDFVSIWFRMDGVYVEPKVLQNPFHRFSGTKSSF